MGQEQGMVRERFAYYMPTSRRLLMPTRRIFLKNSFVTAASLAAASRAVAADGQKPVIGIIGPGGMGTHHTKLLSVRKDIDIAYVCDVDSNKLAAAAKTIESGTGKAPKTVKDMREIFDDKKVDAVFIATPDHW